MEDAPEVSYIALYVVASISLLAIPVVAFLIKIRAWCQKKLMTLHIFVCDTNKMKKGKFAKNDIWERFEYSYGGHSQNLTQKTVKFYGGDQ